MQLSEFMPRRSLVAIFCITTGLVVGALGALVLFMQFAEWWSFGNWNAVSIRYVLGHFHIQFPDFISIVLELPLCLILLGIGGLIVAIGRRYLQKPKASEKGPQQIS
jgi:hypothetical protein